MRLAQLEQLLHRRMISVLRHGHRGINHHFLADRFQRLGHEARMRLAKSEQHLAHLRQMRPLRGIERKLDRVALQTVAQIVRAGFVTKKIYTDPGIGFQSYRRKFRFSHGCLANLGFRPGLKITNPVTRSPAPLSCAMRRNNPETCGTSPNLRARVGTNDCSFSCTVVSLLRLAVENQAGSLANKASCSNPAL